MTHRKPPRKRSLPLAYLNFPRQDSVSKVVEILPEIKEDLETVVVRKFIGALDHFEARRLADLKPTIWPDFEAREGSKSVGIELVEIVDAGEAVLRARREEYLGRVRDLIDDVLPALSGLSITLDDGHQDNMVWPPLRTSEGRDLAAFIADNLRASLLRLESLDDRYMMQNWKESPRAGVTAYRVLPKEAEAPVSIGFSGALFGYPGKGKVLLAQALTKKIKKNYASSSSEQLLLLMYEVGSHWVILEGDDAMTEVVHELLDRADHSFSEVWYFLPYADEDIGHLRKLWPLTHAAAPSAK